MPAITEEIVFEALDAARPEAALRRLASADQPLWCPGIGATGRMVVTRHPAVRSILSDVERFGCAEQADLLLSSLPPRLSATMQPMRSWPLYSDPPEQSRMRSAMSKAFTARRVEALRPVVRARVEDHVHRMGSSGDLISDLAASLPVSTFAHLMGIPQEDCGRLKGWSTHLIRLTEPSLSDGEINEIDHAWHELWQYFSDLIEHKRERPLEDVASALAAGGGADISSDEVVSACITLLLGGHETTTNLIGNLALALVVHPEHGRPAASDERYAAGLVEEVMRLDAPAKTTARIARADTVIDSTPVAAGTRVLLILSAANRDPDVFTQPDTFDPGRRPNPHLGFGFGIHACFGAALSRLQAQEVAAVLGRRTLRADLTGLRWRGSQVLRSLLALPVELS
ncbi:cytochrome P450 [Paractinoplanes maris]|uniref:cytochrome P450 n=1 Tax=Paractinoplanes maris TaxID=1734446 RepID=UPI00202024DA|nr:cytochrome P450 [Actinoplanes maris]